MLILLGVRVEVVTLLDGTLLADLGARALADVLSRGATWHHPVLGHIGVQLVAAWHDLGRELWRRLIKMPLDGLLTTFVIYKQLSIETEVGEFGVNLGDLVVS